MSPARNVDECDVWYLRLYSTTMCIWTKPFLAVQHTSVSILSAIQRYTFEHFAVVTDLAAARCVFYLESIYLIALHTAHLE